jgi:hypothetical protein
MTNGLSLVRRDGFLLLALDGEVIPGQCALYVEDETSPSRPDQPRLVATVVFEVFQEPPEQCDWNSIPRK